MAPVQSSQSRPVTTVSQRSCRTATTSNSPGIHRGKMAISLRLMARPWDPRAAPPMHHFQPIVGHGMARSFRKAKRHLAPRSTSSFLMSRHPLRSSFVCRTSVRNPKNCSNYCSGQSASASNTLYRSMNSSGRSPAPDRISDRVGRMGIFFLSLSCSKIFCTGSSIRSIRKAPASHLLRNKTSCNSRIRFDPSLGTPAFRVPARSRPAAGTTMEWWE